MRLRKTMKRTAAAVLALSMAVSAAALPASAGFNIDMSKVDGDVEITQVDDNGSAKVTIKLAALRRRTISATEKRVMMSPSPATTPSPRPPKT